MKTPVTYVAIAIASLSLVMLTNVATVNADAPGDPSTFGKAANLMNPLNWEMPEFHVAASLVLHRAIRQLLALG